MAPKRMTEEERSLLEDQLMMYEDNIETQRSMGRQIPDSWVAGMAKVKAQLAGKSSREEWVFSLPVFGHPEVTALRGYQNLIPIKVRRSKVFQVDKFIARAIEKANKAGGKWFVAEAIVKGRKPFGPFKSKAAAQRYLQSANGREDIALHDLIRSETVPELQRLRKAVEKA